MTAHAKSSPATDAEWVKGMFEGWPLAGGGALAWMSPVWVSAMSDISAEVTQFVSERIRADIETQQEILQCRDPIELREIQGRYLKTAFDQYSAETGRLIRLNQEVLDQLTGRSDGS
ncbi:phasin family protein [Tropicimonas isoalkanivorans]|uniref:Phasin protein n=1 Tax=Tropicimonas isoalkanivorans TaxID=441112 RepID=A0A1I1JN39_9RHOB|nr:phasin family protein [Tropicimonas isoalkanivorans]SFC49601.1 Phasin protein [Tropicimonas isoalkanivorans]